MENQISDIYCQSDFTAKNKKPREFWPTVVRPLEAKNLKKIIRQKTGYSPCPEIHPSLLVKTRAKTTNVSQDGDAPLESPSYKWYY